MTSIEVIVLTIIAILILPYLCKMIRRPAMLYCTYLLLGTAIGGILSTEAHFLIEEVGKVGFILLLFLIGLEIDLPAFNIIKKSIPFCLKWLAIQIPFFVGIGYMYGIGGFAGFVAGAGLNSCSLGIAYGILQSQKEKLDESSLNKLLISMVILEVTTLFLFAFSDVLFFNGLSLQVLYQLLGLLGFILIIKLFSKNIHSQLSRFIEDTKKWKIHQLLLVLFTIAIIGDKFGLSAPKTAFFLGLFMTATTRTGIKFEDELKPIAHNILIPIFFLSLGAKVSLDNLQVMLPIAGSLTIAAYITRYYIFKWWGELSIPKKYFLLLCPNLTMVAVAVEILEHQGVDKTSIDMLLMTGFLITICSAIYFPLAKKVEPSLIQNTI